MDNTSHGALDSDYTSVTAILVDGGYYRQMALSRFGKHSAAKSADLLESYCLRHISGQSEEKRHLYRIFYYDCPPSNATIRNEYLGTTVKLAAQPKFKWTSAFFDALATKRKFALRMGKLSTTPHFEVKQEVVKKLLDGDITPDALSESSFRLVGLTQKQVDMKIGLDIATLSYQHLVNQIVLIAGDSDFIPVIKLARTSGIDVLLDPLTNDPKGALKPELIRHVDGIETFITEFAQEVCSEETT